MTELDRTIEFAKKENIVFDDISFECKWNDHRVYVPSFDAQGDNFVGLPVYILIDVNGNIRLANTDEVFKILDSLPDE